MTAVRVIAKPVLKKGGRTYGEGVDITSRVIRSLKISEAIDKNDWEAGIVTIPVLKISLWNGDEWLSEGGGHPSPVFARAGRNGSRVEIHAGGGVRYAGYIYEADSAQDLFSATLKISVLSPLSLLRGLTLDAGLISETSAPEDAIRRILNAAPGLDAGMVDIHAGLTNARLYGNGGAGRVSGLSGWQVLSELLIAIGGAGYVSYSADGADMLTVVRSSAVRAGAPLLVPNPDSAVLESGNKRLVNQVRFADDDSRSLPSSVDEFGAQGRDVKYDWLDLRYKGEVAAAILEGGGQPRDLLKVVVPLYEGSLSAVNLLGGVDVRVAETYRDAYAGRGVLFGGELPVRRNEGLDFAGRIIRQEVDLFNNKARLTLERR